MPIYKLGGRMLRDAVNLEFKNGMLRSRDKMKLYMGYAGNGPPVECDAKKFFTLPYGGDWEHKFWVCDRKRHSESSGTWHEYFIYVYNEYRDEKWRQLHTFSSRWSLGELRAFRLPSDYISDLWVLSLNENDSLVLDCNALTVRELGMQNNLQAHGDESASSDWRAFGFEFAEMMDGATIRSSGVRTEEGLKGLAGFDEIGYYHIHFWLSATIPTGATHVRLWLGDKLDSFSSDRTELYPVFDMPINELQAAVPGPTGSIITESTGRNGFFFRVHKRESRNYEIVFEETHRSTEPGALGAEASTKETMNLVPMPNAQCEMGGILFGVKPGHRDVIAYSSNPGTVYREQTTALRVVAAGIGRIIGLLPMKSGLAAFGTMGIARVHGVGSGFAAQKIAGLDLEGMRCIPLPGIGAACAGRGKIIFVDENTFETGEMLMGLPIAEMLGDLAKDVRAMDVADNKLYIISGSGSGIEGSRLFCLDLATAALAEIRVAKFYIYKPVDIWSNDNSAMLFTFAMAPSISADQNPSILSLAQGEPFENAMSYEAAFCASSAYGFVQPKLMQAVAKLGRCSSLTLYMSVGGARKSFAMPLKSQMLKNADEYQDYAIASDDGCWAAGKTEEARLVFYSEPGAGGGNDGLELLSVRMARLRQDAVSAPSFNMGGGRP
jgi:hypothetical protein